MLLNMDEKGNVYQAASHRSDGLGFENIAEVVDEKDVYYENAALETSREINQANLLYDKYNLIDKMREDQYERLNEQLKKKARKIQNVVDELILNPDIQEDLKYNGLIQNMEKSADFNQLEISGYGLSSDGIIGPSARDRAVELALSQQMGKHIPIAEINHVGEAVYDVDKYEKEAYQLENMYKTNQYLGAEVSKLAYLPPEKEIQETKKMLDISSKSEETTPMVTSNFLSKIKPIHIALAAIAILLLKRRKS